MYALPVKPINFKKKHNKIQKFLPITLSQNAIKRIKELLTNQKEQKFFRIQVHNGGCAGLRYEFSFDTTKNRNDIQYIQENITMIIDKQSMPYIQGSTILYLEKLIGSYFAVQNPQSKSSCGCGSSFSI